MTDIRLLTHVSTTDLQRVIGGYTSLACYRVQRTDSDSLINFLLELEPLEIPYVKEYELPDEADVRKCLDAEHGRSLGVYQNEQLVGLALTEAQPWSNRLWVQEFHVTEAHRGTGIGTLLMNTLINRAQQEGFRAIMLETQNTNVPAIRFYRKLGFTLDGIDLALYSNKDYPNGEIALFMTRKLQS